MMLRFGIILLALNFATIARGTPPPPPEPINIVVQKLISTHIPLCVSITEELRHRLPAEEVKRLAEKFSVLDIYLQNIRADDVSGLQRALNEPSDGSLPYWSNRLVTDSVGFRRAVDEVIVESLASGSLKPDEKLIEQLRRFWKSEYYFSWRFGVEAAPSRR